MDAFKDICKKSDISVKFRFTKFSLRIILLIIIVVPIFWICRCESAQRFYRPNLPEKLCVVGIIDIDDTTLRHITFEKSFQSEFTGEVNNPLRNFSFSISSTESELFNFSSASPIMGPKVFKIPANSGFRAGEKYYLNAREDSTSAISAITSAPSPPCDPLLISVTRGIIVTTSSDCLGNSAYKLANIEFSFANNPEQESYYAIYIEEIDHKELDPSSGIKDIYAWPFDLKECNTTGFFARVPGLTQNQLACVNNSIEIIKVPLLLYFIEGRTIPGEKCHMVISTIFHDDANMWKQRRRLKIKVLSLPKELFLYEKSLYTYGNNSQDPFSEPIYLNGNIKEGNGIFAICRSVNMFINMSPAD